MKHGYVTVFVKVNLKFVNPNPSQSIPNGRVAQRITRLTTDQKIAGSNPAVLDKHF